jgi:hypothetical protein
VRDFFDGGPPASCVLQALFGQRLEVEEARTSACSRIFQLGDGECDACDGDDEGRATCGYEPE